MRTNNRPFSTFALVFGAVLAALVCFAGLKAAIPMLAVLLFPLSGFTIVAMVVTAGLVIGGAYLARRLARKRKAA
ncbi:MAG: hypothetical protein LBK95_07800 [Bifidobacteriaceae bacterium]|jgi:hypothetical protein|nr:hypothetical protein [Bifidobacteriaceae bacterium]